MLLEEQYQELEVWVPYLRLKEEGHESLLVGRERGAVYRGKFGYPAQAEVSYAKLESSEVDAVVVPGGFAPDFMRRYPEPARLVKAVFDAGRPVAAICHGAWLLCSAGILKGRTATCFFAIADDVRNAGARWVDREVVVDGNLITSRKPEDLPAFCRELIKSLR
ncbi:MAG: type 1 glutamine amidotransferase domain-containing protein [Elusimicrobiota bacterium]